LFGVWWWVGGLLCHSLWVNGLVELDNDLKLHSEKFEMFMNQYKKSYNNTAHTQRFSIFRRNLAKIAELNGRVDDGQFMFGVNRFSDLSSEEFSTRFLMNPDVLKATTKVLGESLSSAAHSLDSEKIRTVSWLNITTPVRYQGTCGGCWAISATQQVESKWIMAGQSMATLSAQQVIDCATVNGCKGGSPQLAYSYMKKHSLKLAAEYPYTALTGKCSPRGNAVSGLNVIGFGFVGAGDETKMMQAIQKGPLGVCVAADSWQHYKSGVLTADMCTGKLNHCVQAVGLDVSETGGWWRIKNSWGGDWGEDGFIRLPVRKDACLITYSPYDVQVRCPPAPDPSLLWPPTNSFPYHSVCLITFCVLCGQDAAIGRSGIACFPLSFSRRPGPTCRSSGAHWSEMRTYWTLQLN